MTAVAEYDSAKAQSLDTLEKRAEPIAFNAGVTVRTLREFLSQHREDHDRPRDRLQPIVRDEHARLNSIGILNWRSSESCADPRQSSSC